MAPRVAAACAHAALAALSAEDGSGESGSIMEVEGIAQGHRYTMFSSLVNACVF